jgi:F-type H+-transporting ATPase subunit epsilon
MIKLEVVTPERKVVSGSVDQVTIPTLKGEVGILPNHAPMISALKPGILSYTQSGTASKLVIAGGFVEVGVNTVSVLAEIAENAEEVDTTAAKSAKDEAEKVLTGWKGTEEELEAELEKLERATARIQLAAGK